MFSMLVISSTRFFLAANNFVRACSSPALLHRFCRPDVSVWLMSCGFFDHTILVLRESHLGRHSRFE